MSKKNIQFRKSLFTLVLILGLIISGCINEKDLIIDHSKHFLHIENPADGSAIVDEVIQIYGKHNYPKESHIWIILEDNLSNYYLQYPPCRLISDSTWYAKNIHIGRDITQIHSVYVNKKGNKILNKMAEKKQWGSLKDFPEGSKILSTINIKKQ